MEQGVSFWTVDQLKIASGGVVVARPAWASGAHPGVRIEGVSIDSRSIADGQVFIAIRGENFDGHDFLAEACEAGALVLIIDREDAAIPGPTSGRQGRGVVVIRVPDTRRALLKLAQAYRRTLNQCKVIAVCGSNGKTTTVRLIEGVLAQRFRGSASKKSHNNDIGVPLTILAARATDQFLICEVGTNAPGEISMLGGVVEPDICVITSIGREHLEKLRDLRGVAREESAILSHLRPGGLGIITADSPELAAIVGEGARFGDSPLLRFGRASNAELRLTGCEHTSVTSAGAEPTPGLTFEVNGRARFQLPMEGEHNACNALAAIGVARRMGMDDDSIGAGLGAVKPAQMRWERRTIALERGSITLINDAYNANPDSMIAGLRTFVATCPKSRRVFVMGDMFELGDANDQGHRDVGAFLGASGGVDVLITVGKSALLAGEAYRGAFAGAQLLSVPELSPSAIDRIVAMINAGDAVLLKGSRRARLERLAEVIEQLGGRVSGDEGVAGGAMRPVPAVPVQIVPAQPHVRGSGTATRQIS